MQPIDSFHHSRPAHARFVWLDGLGASRNCFARFTRLVDVAERPCKPVFLHLFADTRYRLRVNGDFVAAGPARFVTQFPEFDSHDLAPLLAPGKNLIEVEVNFFGASSYQSMPDGKPGFIAWGGGDLLDLATPGEWSGEKLDAWRPDAPLFSFAQNPVEICDTRLLEQGSLRSLRLLEGAESPWGELRPCSGRPVRFQTDRPRRIETAGALLDSERLYGFMANGRSTALINQGEQRLWAGFATWMHSPRDQTVEISCFWGDLFCNGQPVMVDTSTPLGNHGFCAAALREGWNLFTGRFEILTEYWAWCLGIPIWSGVTLHARPDERCAQAMAISPQGSREEINLPGPDADCPPEGWRAIDGDPSTLTPARVMGWDRIAPGAPRDLPVASLPEFSMIEAASATWCFSFDGEFMGYLDCEVEGPPGTILDAAYDDWQTPEGGVSIYRSNPFTDAADRFILRGGRQRIEGFHPRGGKLLQLTLRAPGGIPAALSVHSARVLSRRTFPPDQTRFECDLPALEWSWPVALRTLIVSTDESFNDCPWRERGSYIGDCRVNIHLNALMDSDMRTARRTLALFAQAPLPGGQLPCCAPSWLRRPHEDFTLIWILSLRDLWELTGDLEFVERLWPAVLTILDADLAAAPAHGLRDSEELNLFIDWGVLIEERKGKANTAFNLFRFAAFQAAAALAAALGDQTTASRFSNEAARIEEGIFSYLWCEKSGRLRPSADLNTPGLHANALALAFKAGDADRRLAILSAIEPQLRDNLTRGLTNGQFSGHIELYFLHFLLPALAEHGRPDLAEAMIADHYGFLQGLGDDTMPECFCRVQAGVGSRCHSWSGAAAIYAARYLLGLRQIQPGNPDRFLCAPVVSGITRASGRIAHPRGWIGVSWDAGRERARIHAPDGVTIDWQPDGIAARLNAPAWAAGPLRQNPRTGIGD